MKFCFEVMDIGDDAYFISSVEEGTVFLSKIRAVRVQRTSLSEPFKVYYLAEKTLSKIFHREGFAHSTAAAAAAAFAEIERMRIINPRTTWQSDCIADIYK